MQTIGRGSFQTAIRGVSVGATKDIQRISAYHTDGVAKGYLSRRVQRSWLSHKVEPEHGSSDAMSMDTLADAAKIAEEDEKLKNKPCYIIDPAATGMNVWDGVTALALVFTAMVTPFEVGFLSSAETPLDALFLINRLLDGPAEG